MEVLPGQWVPSTSRSSIPPIYRCFTRKGEQHPVFTQQAPVSLCQTLCPLPCSSPRAVPRVYSSRAQLGLQTEQRHPAQGSRGPQAVTAQPKGQFDLVKGISVSPARQLRAQRGFLPWNSDTAITPNTSSSLAVPDPAPAPARAGWAPLLTRPPRRCPWPRAGAPQLFPQHKWKRDIIKGLRMHKAGSHVLR